MELNTMLPYALAIAVGLSSSFLFLTAFFFKDIHRRDDFFWSTIGLFYALVLWFCATGITGAVLLGQLAVVALLTAYIWQTIKLRDAIAHPEKQADLDSFSVTEFLKNRFLRSPVLVKPEVANPTETVTTEPNIVNKEDRATPETQPVISKPEIATDMATSDNLEEDSASETNKTLVKTDSAEIVKTETENATENSTEVKSPTSTESNNTSVTKLIEEDVSPDTDTATTTEIAVEKVTIIEEETNWDDEVEDISVASVTVIEEVSEKSPSTTESIPLESEVIEDKEKNKDSDLDSDSKQT